MALNLTHNEIEFGVGDLIRVYQKIKEGDKSRVAYFEGMVLGIKGDGDRKMFTVRRIGEAGVGIEKIFPISLPTITEIKIIKKGQKGVRHAKLFYTRDKSTKEIDKIYSRHNRRVLSKAQPQKKSKVKKSVKSLKKTVIKK